MKICKIKFGEAHGVTALGDVFKGKQNLYLACHPAAIELANDNRHRFVLYDSTADAVGCVECREKLGLDREEEQNAD